jgi:hypothetical protein
LGDAQCASPFRLADRTFDGEFEKAFGHGGTLSTRLQF